MPFSQDEPQEGPATLETEGPPSISLSVKVEEADFDPPPVAARPASPRRQAKTRERGATSRTKQQERAGSSLKNEVSRSVSPPRLVKARSASSPVAPESRASGKGVRSNQPKGLANHPTQPSVGRQAPAKVEEDFPFDGAKPISHRFVVLFHFMIWYEY